MSTTTTSFQRLIGQTEKTLNAILIRLLAGAVSEPEWIALVLVAGGGGPAQVAWALKSDQEAARSHLASLAAKGLVRLGSEPGAAVSMTEAGQRLLNHVQAEVGDITLRLWGDLPAADMEVTSRVLHTVLERAEAELSAAS